MASWNQPICTDCWHLRNGERRPVRLKSPVREHCCYCDRAVKSGIYVRVDPTTVPYPTEDADG